MPGALELPEDIERLALLGWHLYPSSARTRALLWQGANLEATYDLDTLARWAAAHPGCNWRVALGRSGLWALDIDVPGGRHQHDGRATLQELLAKPGHSMPRDAEGRLAVTMTRSGGGGWCLLFERPEGLAIRGKGPKNLPGIDPLREGQSITVPPSRHIDTGEPYRWIHPPWETTPRPAPDWLVKLYRAPPPPKVTAEPEMTTERVLARLLRSLAVVQSTKANRNDTLNRQSFIIGLWIAQGKLPQASSRVALYEAALQCGLEARESITTIDHAFRRAAAAPNRGG
jgi:hypothetical protein